MTCQCGIAGCLGETYAPSEVYSLSHIEGDLDIIKVATREGPWVLLFTPGEAFPRPEPCHPDALKPHIGVCLTDPNAEPDRIYCGPAAAKWHETVKRELTPLLEQFRAYGGRS